MVWLKTRRSFFPISFSFDLLLSNLLFLWCELLSNLLSGLFPLPSSSFHGMSFPTMISFFNSFTPPLWYSSPFILFFSLRSPNYPLWYYSLYQFSVHLQLVSVQVRPIGIQVILMSIQIIPIGIKVIQMNIQVISMRIQVIPIGMRVIPIGIQVIPIGMQVIHIGIQVIPMRSQVIPIRIRVM